MQDNGSVTFSGKETDALFSLVRSSIRRGLHADTGMDDEAGPEVPPQGVLHDALGAFVTLKRHGALRGCIGHIVGDGPLYATVVSMAQAAAFQDPRFTPLTPEELEGLELEISVMGPIDVCADPSRIEVGRHGLIVRRGMHSGLLLPQVAVEWGWDRETFLAQTCRKAGLDAGCWQDAATQLFWFEAIVLGPEKY